MASKGIAGTSGRTLAGSVRSASRDRLSCPPANLRRRSGTFVYNPHPKSSSPCSPNTSTTGSTTSPRPARTPCPKSPHHPAPDSEKSANLVDISVTIRQRHDAAPRSARDTSRNGLRDMPRARRTTPEDWAEFASSQGNFRISEIWPGACRMWRRCKPPGPGERGGAPSPAGSRHSETPPHCQSGRLANWTVPGQTVVTGRAPTVPFGALSGRLGNRFLELAVTAIRFARPHVRRVGHPAVSPTR